MRFTSKSRSVLVSKITEIFAEALFVYVLQEILLFLTYLTEMPQSAFLTVETWKNRPRTDVVMNIANALVFSSLPLKTRHGRFGGTI